MVKSVLQKMHIRPLSCQVIVKVQSTLGGKYSSHCTVLDLHYLTLLVVTFF